MSRETLQQKVERLERDNEELCEALRCATARWAALESGAASAEMKRQRDILLLFARSCWIWSHTCQCGHRADAALEQAGFRTTEQSDAALAAVDPRLALELLR